MKKLCGGVGDGPCHEPPKESLRRFYVNQVHYALTL
jgi:hypothetical protein